MSDWDSVTKIGKSVRGGVGERETVVKGKSALNAAMRSGAVIGSEKKYAIGNAVSLSPSLEPSSGYEHLQQVKPPEPPRRKHLTSLFLPPRI
jgi:hypothetical protein